MQGLDADEFVEGMKKKGIRVRAVPGPGPPAPTCTPLCMAVPPPHAAEAVVQLWV